VSSFLAFDLQRWGWSEERQGGHLLLDCASCCDRARLFTSLSQFSSFIVHLRSVNCFFTEWMNEWMNQSINQWINEWTIQSILPWTTLLSCSINLHVMQLFTQSVSFLQTERHRWRRNLLGGSDDAIHAHCPSCCRQTIGAGWC